jgi:hypothetical protein
VSIRRNGKALRRDERVVELDLRRHRKLLPIDHGVDQYGAFMGECRLYRRRNLERILDADAANADGLRTFKVETCIYGMPSCGR